jgi:hypothetical protein
MHRVNGLHLSLAIPKHVSIFVTPELVKGSKINLDGYIITDDSHQKERSNHTNETDSSIKLCSENAIRTCTLDE